MIQFGNDKIKEIYFGSDKIKEVYHGSEKVWGSGQDGYWVHKDTGVKTYFGLEDSSIEGGVMSSPSWRSNCSEVKLPSGVTDLRAECFRFCSSLTSIIMPEGVVSLGIYCFAACTALTSVIIPETVVSLGNSCFRSCSSLTLVTSLPIVPPSLGTYGFRDTHANLIIKVPAQSVNAYKNATNWYSHASKISAI